jgi:aldehyde dehydrogenase (NAD+)
VYLCIYACIYACILQAQALKQKMLQCYKVFYGQDPKKSPDFGRLISKDAARRVQQLLEQPGANVGEVLIGGQVDVEDRYVAPTILSETPASSKLMEEEIFGPVVSVVTTSSVEDAIRYVDSITRDPLALYVFSSRPAIVSQIIEAIPSGGVVVNDCMVHQGLPNMPFGGRGDSGLGTYHGRFSFETFSQKRTILYKHFNRNHPLIDFWIRYPPVDGTKAFLLTWFARNLPLLPGRVSGVLKALIVAASLLYAAYLFWRPRIGL